MSHSQQTLLHDVMQRLNLTRDRLANRIGVDRKTLDSWIALDGDKEYQTMPDAVKHFIGGFLQQLGLQTDKSFSTKGFLRDRILYNGKNHLLSADQFNRDAVEEFIQIVNLMQPIARRFKASRLLEGAVLGSLFFEASTRTRIGFSSAFCLLGGSVCGTTGFESSSMAKGESICDTGRVISAYVDAIVIRHPSKGSAKELSCSTNIPVINGGDGPGEHPSQALLDLYTILNEFSKMGKDLDGAHVAILGDLKYSRTVHSLVKLLSLYHGIKFSFLSIPGLEMSDQMLEQASRNTNVVSLKSTLDECINGADIVYVTRIQKERFKDNPLKNDSAPMEVNRAMVNAYCSPETLIMHPLPCDTRPGSNDPSIGKDLKNDPRLAIFRQSDNGTPVRMAIFAVLLGVEKMVSSSMSDISWKSPISIGPNDPPTLGLF